MAEAAAERLARYYDLDLADEPADFDLYAALAERTGGPVLELAVGTGRIAVPLAAAGRSVTGIDHDPATLARAERRWSTARSNGRAPAGAHLELVTGDLLRVPASPRFALSILAFNSLLLLETAERQAAAVRRLARHLRPGGLAAIDVWLPGVEDLGLYDGRLVGEWERTDPETGERVAKVTTARHDAATATVELRTWFDTWPSDGGPLERISRLDRLRLVGADELAGWLRAAGLEVESLGGDWDMRPFGPGADRLVAIARRTDRGGAAGA